MTGILGEMVTAEIKTLIEVALKDQEEKLTKTEFSRCPLLYSPGDLVSRITKS